MGDTVSSAAHVCSVFPPCAWVERQGGGPRTLADGLAEGKPAEVHALHSCIHLLLRILLHLGAVHLRVRRRCRCGSSPSPPRCRAAHRVNPTRGRRRIAPTRGASASGGRRQPRPSRPAAAQQPRCSVHRPRPVAALRCHHHAAVVSQHDPRTVRVAAAQRARSPRAHPTSAQVPTGANLRSTAGDWTQRCRCRRKAGGTGHLLANAPATLRMDLLRCEHMRCGCALV